MRFFQSIQAKISESRELVCKKQVCQNCRNSDTPVNVRENRRHTGRTRNDASTLLYSEPETGLEHTLGAITQFGEETYPVCDGEIGTQRRGLECEIGAVV